MRRGPLLRENVMPCDLQVPLPGDRIAGLTPARFWIASGLVTIRHDELFQALAIAVAHV
jgi:hypothetical protein